MIYLGENQLDNIYIGSSSVNYIYLDDVQVYPYEHDYSRDYFTTVALSSGTISFSGASTANTLSYSTNRGQTWSTAEQNQSVPVSSGDKVLWKGANSGTTTIHGIGKFYASSSYNVEGNAHSLFYEDDFRGRTDLPNKNYSHAELFRGSTTLKNAENLVLPATQMNPYTYLNMFYDCTSLETAPQLPARTLARACYQYMFNNCTSLTEAPALTARTLAQECYNGMFYGCTSLTEAPALPATTLNISCYMRMFRGCSGLTTPMSVLPATNLAYCDDCYREMFCSCTAMTSAPELPATTLAYECYRDMFYECRSLTEAPELPATTLVSMCYQSMFKDCSILSAITCHATDISANNCTNGWVYGVAASGVFTKPEEMESWTVGQNGIPVGWTVQDITHDYSQDYFTTVALSSGRINFSGVSTATTLSYSTDQGQTWSTPSRNPSVNVSEGGKVLWKGECTPLANKGIGAFTSAATATYNVEGNVMSLLYGDNFRGQTDLSGKDYAFNTLFNGNTKLVNAANLSLPATTLSDFCYQNMFNGCTSLTEAPQLPATTLASYCYRGMFSNCTSLTSAPQLPATTLTMSCYSDMFNGCTSLTEAPQLSSTTLANRCYNGMFNACTSLTEAPELPATTLAERCYYYMFSGCTSLTETPQLPATTLATYCYLGMFNGCTSLTEAPQLPATTLASGCYYGMFEGCTSLTEAPQLPATTLAYQCYLSMFQNCSSLSAITCHATDISASNCTNGWVSGVAASGVFTKPAEMESWTVGTSGIPVGWIVQDITHDYSQDYFTTKALSSGTISFSGSSTANTLSYSTDQGQTWTTASQNPSVNVLSGDTVLWKGSTVPITSDGIGRFSSSGNFEIEGNAMSLIHGDNFQNQISLSGKPFAFLTLLYNNSTLISAENLVLPATTLDNSCYKWMFNACTNLQTAPELPATTMSNYSYYGMFYMCTSLTTAPQLPATTLAEGCYLNMFSYCTGLTSAPTLSASTLAYGCYNAMFSDCTGLTSSPALTASTLAESCYMYMFSGCSSLSSVTCLATDISASLCTYHWLDGVAASGTFIQSNLMSDWTCGVDGIPQDWDVITQYGFHVDSPCSQPEPWPTCTEYESCCQDSRMMTAGEALNDIQGEYVEDRFVNITIYEGTIYDGEWYFTNYGDGSYVIGLRSDGSGDWESSSDGENWDTVTFYSGEATFDCYNIYSGDVGFYNRGQSSEQYVPFDCYCTFWFGDEETCEGGGDEPEPDPEEGVEEEGE